MTKGVTAAEETARIEAKAGRSAYVEEKHLMGVADPGAWGVKLILEAIAEN
jgi:dihydroxyacetone kinase